MHSLHVLIISIVAIVIIYYIVSVFVLQQHAINKQSVYVHLQPEWNSYPGNIVYDITNVWGQTQSEQLSSQARLEIAKNTNVDKLQYVHGKSYILVQHDNTNCHDSWEPHYARFGADIIRHQIEYMTGLQSSPDPNVTLYNQIPSKQDPLEHESQIKSGYSQFIPVCTEKDTSTFDYSVRINDSTVGFDVYFVQSIQEQENYDQSNNKFQYYVTGQCFGKNFASFSGTCHNVGKNSGLLIVIPDNLSLPLTKFDVWLYEK